MKKSEIKRLLKPSARDAVQITLTSSDDQREATIHFKSSVRMTGLDFLMALIDYANDLAEQMYMNANETDESKN